MTFLLFSLVLAAITFVVVRPAMVDGPRLSFSHFNGIILNFFFLCFFTRNCYHTYQSKYE